MTPLEELQDHLEQCCVEYVARVNSLNEWCVYPTDARIPMDDTRRYDIDENVTEGPVVLVRRSDGQRFEVDVSVTVWPSKRQSPALPGVVRDPATPAREENRR